jgi:hypothetical protein
VHITTQPKQPETTHTNDWLEIGFSVLHSAARISPPPSLQAKSLFSKTLPLSHLDGILCEPNKGYPGHKLNVPKTLRNQVQKNYTRIPQRISRQPFVDAGNDPHWRMAET